MGQETAFRTCIIQSASGTYTRLQRSQFDNHAKYCERHNIQYLCNLGDVQGERHPMWDRVPLIQFALILGNELVVWMDTDSVIVDHSVDIRDAAREFSHVGMVRHPAPWRDQPWHYNAGVSFFRNTPQTLDFLARVQRMGQIDHHWQVQATMLYINDEMNVIERIDDKWNSTDWNCPGGLNLSQSPVISAFHGQGERAASIKIERLLKSLKASLW